MKLTKEQSLKYCLYIIVFGVLLFITDMWVNILSVETAVKLYVTLGCLSGLFGVYYLFIGEIQENKDNKKDNLLK